MKKLGIYIIICVVTILLRDNICFFYGNVLGVFKLDNNYYEGIIKLKDEQIEYLEKEINDYDKFSKELNRITYNYKLSKITFKESYNIGKFTIQYGSKDNVKVGNAVTNENSFIGKITKVDKYTSELTLIKDLKDTSVVVNNIYGKLNYDYELNEFIISDISNYDKVYINDEVYTSGYGTIKEKLYIGKVEKVETYVYSKKIYVSTKVNFNNLNYLLIVGDI